MNAILERLRRPASAVRIPRRRLPLGVASAVLVGALVAALAGPAHAQDFDYRGSVESDLRVAVPGNDAPAELPDYFFDTIDAIAQLTAALTWGDARAVIDLSMVFSGMSEVEGFRDLYNRADVDPWYFESDALYVEIYDFVLDGVDLRMGRQIVNWGKADRFNPTSVTNPYDLSDPIAFGAKVANEMVTLSISPPWYVDGEEIPIVDEINLTLVAIPVFRSLLLPGSAETAFTTPDQFARFVNAEPLQRLIDVQKAFLQYGEIPYDLTVREPEPELENMQAGAHYGMSIYGVDIGLMYYHGFDHNVQPEAVDIQGVFLADGSELVLPPIDITDPNAVNVLIDLVNQLGAMGTLDGSQVPTGVRLGYPRVDVVGADFATSLDFLGGMGLWAEFAATFHDGVRLDISLGDQGPCGSIGPDGEPLDDTDGCIARETQVQDGWFWKLTAGVDYSITSWWYLNIQYLHGFVDEFGSENLGDYIVAGMDFKAVAEQLLIRIFSVVELDTNTADMSAILYPELTFTFWQSASLVLGALIHVGEGDTKFGNRTAGPNLVFLKGRYAF